MELDEVVDALFVVKNGDSGLRSRLRDNVLDLVSGLLTESGFDLLDLLIGFDDERHCRGRGFSRLRRTG
jgi:hypothetical protein